MAEPSVRVITSAQFDRQAAGYGFGGPPQREAHKVQAQILGRGLPPPAADGRYWFSRRLRSRRDQLLIWLLGELNDAGDELTLVETRTEPPPA